MMQIQAARLSPTLRPRPTATRVTPRQPDQPDTRFSGRAKVGPFKFLALMILGAAGALAVGKIKPPKKRFFNS